MSQYEMRREALRDEFAARSTQGWVRAIACNQEAENLLKRGGVEPGNVEAFVARCCYDMADAMLRERAKRDGTKELDPDTCALLLEEKRGLEAKLATASRQLHKKFGIDIDELVRGAK